MTKPPVYFDNFATTEIAPEVASAIIDAWRHPTNAASPHLFGARAAAQLDEARQRVATALRAAPSEITFTSGATEANNLVLRGIADWALSGHCPRRKIIVSAIEHKSVLEPALSLVSRGFDIVLAPVKCDGILDLPAMEGLIDQDTLLVSVMAVNNETGVIQPISEMVQLARRCGALIHSDGAQALGKLDIDVGAWAIDYMSLSAHKAHGPMGMGALYVAAGAPHPFPQITGGGQQAGKRSGTEPVPLAVGFGIAAELAAKGVEVNQHALSRKASTLFSCLEGGIPGLTRVTEGSPTVAGSLCLKIKNVPADDFVQCLQSAVCISTGSACSSGQLVPSHVLKAMGLSQVDAESVFRVMLSKYATDDQITTAASQIIAAHRRLQDRTGLVRQSGVEGEYETWPLRF